MSKRSRLSNFLVSDKRISSQIEYKQAILRGQLSILLGVVCLFYLIMDPLSGIYPYIPFYLGGIFTSLAVIYLNRRRRPDIASIILLLVTNFLVFNVADTSSPDSGVYFFFADMVLVALVLFYNSNMKIGFGFMVLTILLGVVAYFNDNSMVESVELSGLNKDINFIINLIIGILTAVLVILFVIRRNNESEASLTRNKERLEQITKQLKIKNNELQKTNEELDRFVYSASHDMRAPLSTLLGLIQISKVSNDPQEIQQYFDMMTSRIHDMEGFIKEVTDYSRNSRMEVNVEQVNIKEILVDIRQSFAYLANESLVKIELNIPKNLGIKTDPARLKVVLNNLLVNAIKYFDARKTERFVNVSAVEREGQCIIQIEDNGVGIPEQYQPKIFNMFFRASVNTIGSGLGLYIVKETVEKLNGTVIFKSTPLKGSVFSVELPIVLTPTRKPA